MSNPLASKLFLMAVLGVGATASWLFAAPADSDAPLTDLEVNEAAWDDTARRRSHHKISGLLKTQLDEGSFAINAALYRDGRRQRPIFGVGNGIPPQNSPIELRFVAAATASEDLQLDEAPPETSRLSLTLTLSAAGGDTTTAGPAERDVPKAVFDAGEIRGLVVFDDRALPEHPDKSAVIPLAAWITGAGPIQDYSADVFDIDDFARNQLKAGKGQNRAILVLYLIWRPETD